ncbi:aminotransferase [Candidatus Marinarcus aquaticus]|uniref:cysteine-S-conjugate beta-lyase n=1 Tax=Candidatus Marinarcus aquaticus TaxID=2044504 RepID=A0A4Q0XST3_9BACT|nr:aminotransferase [Candidatus Marinarcus aquaticus]
MVYSFDKEVNRNHTQCAKYDGLEKYFGVNDAFPMWVADMDFETPAFINDAIIKRAHHAVYGYGIVTESLQQSVVNWMQTQHGWKIQKKWLTFLNGVVPAYSAALEAFSEVNDEIIVQTPVYFPLFQSIKHNKRKVVYNPLKEQNGYYTMDLEDLKSKITPKTKIFTLCSPHNPVGRIWSKEELEALAKICLEHNITIISDEIHADITFKPFTPLASISKEIANITVTLNAAGKTFNIAGLNAAYAITCNEALKTKLDEVVKAREIGSINVFGTIAMEAAYTYGQEWVKELKEYLLQNILVTKELLKNTNIKLSQPEATYLLWLDFSCYDLTHLQIKERLLKEAKIALNDGLTFGKNGSKHFRLNVALPVTRLKKYLNIIAKTF